MTWGVDGVEGHRVDRFLMGCFLLLSAVSVLLIAAIPIILIVKALV